LRTKVKKYRQELTPTFNHILQCDKKDWKQLQSEARSGHAFVFETGYNWDHKPGESELFSLALRSVTPTDATIK
jgi:hypothetical protein